jgi:hypothetical protein
VDHARLRAVLEEQKTFSHGLGQTEKSGRSAGKSDLPPRTDIPATGRIAPEAAIEQPMSFLSKF